jgi:hypothetical protein
MCASQVIALFDGPKAMAADGVTRTALVPLKPLVVFSGALGAAAAYAIDAPGFSCDTIPTGDLQAYLCGHQRLFFLLMLVLLGGVVVLVARDASPFLKHLSFGVTLPCLIVAWILWESQRAFWASIPILLLLHRSAAAWVLLTLVTVSSVLMWRRAHAPSNRGESS